MVRKIYRLISWGLLGITLVAILLMLRRPSLPPVEVSADSAKSFDSKLNQVDEAHLQGRPQEIHITEVELNSKVQESIESAPGAAARMKAATVRLQGDRLQGSFTVNVNGRDIYVTLEGILSVSNGTLEFKPTNVQIGSLPVPLSFVESTLREKLNSPEMRERMKLPDSIKDVRIEDGELVLQAR